MKFAFVILALQIALLTPLWPQGGGTQHPRLTLLKASFQGAVERGLAPLREAQIAELRQLKDSFAKAGDLPSALAVDSAIQGKAAGPAPERLTRLLMDHARASERIVTSLRTTYLRELEKLKIELTRTGELQGALQTDAELKAQQVLAAGVRPDGLPVYSLVIEVFIDGPSELRVAPESLHWINGVNAKPGFSGKGDEPVLVNDAKWILRWAKPEMRRGMDTSDRFTLPFRVDPGKLDFKLIAVSAAPKGTGIEKRDDVVTALKNGELSVAIPDTQSGQRWYKFALIPKSGVSQSLQ